MRITTAARIENNTWRRDPDTGFLRCTAAILCSGVMDYTRADLAGADIPEGLGNTIRLYVPFEELADPESIDSLEGKPAVVGHTWQTAGAMTDCGNIAGTPAIQGECLVADILVTEPEAVRRVMLPEGDPMRLQDISSAGDWTIIFAPGTTPDGQAYDGYFVKLRYNHVALLPPGAGRAGASVRIINEKEAKPMEVTRVKYRGRTIRVLNEDVEKMDEIMNEDAEAAAKPTITPEQLQEALDELATLKEETKAKNDRIAELEGMIQAYKDQLDAALSPAAVEEAAAEMAADLDEATAVMNSAGLQLGADAKKLRGHALRTHVLNSVRVKNGKSELTADEAKDESLVKGMYKATAEITGHARKVPGAEVVPVQNSNKNQQSATLANPKDRMARLYPKAEGK